MTDKEKIDTLTNLFFGVFDNTQKEPDWSLLPTLCLPGILIIKKEGLKEEIYDLHSFMEPRKKLLSDGTLTKFKESETKEETFISGHLAQRASTYQKSGILNGKNFQEHGTKLFQFINTETGWKISSVIWEDSKK